jgi:hypothetical protein
MLSLPRVGLFTKKHATTFKNMELWEPASEVPWGAQNTGHPVLPKKLPNCISMPQISPIVKNQAVLPGHLLRFASREFLLYDYDPQQN